MIAKETKCMWLDWSMLLDIGIRWNEHWVNSHRLSGTKTSGIHFLVLGVSFKCL